MNNQNSSFHVVINSEEQYSVWPHSRELPEGWSVVETLSSKDECLDYIEQVWTDIRPKSLRDQLAKS